MRRTMCWLRSSSERALFFGGSCRAATRLPSEMEDALWELVAAGLVTADGFENLRALIDPKRRRGEGRGRHARPRHAAGRWALVRRARRRSTRGSTKWAEQLLRRWGVLLRDLLAREAGAPPWRDLLPVLRRMEAQGKFAADVLLPGLRASSLRGPEALRSAARHPSNRRRSARLLMSRARIR